MQRRRFTGTEEVEPGLRKALHDAAPPRTHVLPLSASELSSSLTWDSQDSEGAFTPGHFSDCGSEVAHSFESLEPGTVSRDQFKAPARRQVHFLPQILGPM